MSKIKDPFKASVLVEATRFYHAGEALSGSAEQDNANQRARASGGSFSQRLFNRALALDSSPSLNSAIDKLLRIQRYTLIVISLVIFVLGYLSAQFMLFAQNDQGVNSYWLLLGLIFPNMFAMLFFLVVYNLPKREASLSLIGAVKKLLARILARMFKTMDAHQESVFNAWQHVFFEANYSRTWLALWVQRFWLLFLIGSILALIVRFNVHQYFFGWESTLLPESFFVNATQTLSQPLSMLGLTVPSNSDVLASNLKVDYYPDPSIAMRWAYFIILSCLVYAFLPRLILSLYFELKHKLTKDELLLDTSALEYAKLFPLLMLEHYQKAVVDDDRETPSSREQQHSSELSFDVEQIPRAAHFICIEHAASVPAELQASAHFLGTAEDRASQRSILNALDERGIRTLVVMISLLSLSERGTVRYLKQLKASKRKLMVLLIDQQSSFERLGTDVFAQRLLDWRNALSSIDVDIDQVAMVEAHNSALQARLLDA